MLLGYNTNGWANHRLLDAIEILAEIGYRSIAITLDHDALNPFDADLADQLDAVSRLLERYQLRSVIETGARFLLNPRIKHEPTLVSPRAGDRRQRIDFLCRAIEIARRLGSDCVSFWSGVDHDGADDDEVWQRLTEGTRHVIDVAELRGVKLGFEPEPGMFVDRMERFAAFLERIKSPHLGLTLDVGHLHCLGEKPIADHVTRWSSRLVNVHIEDMRAGIHEHLMFGEGEMEFPPILQALSSIGYRGGIHVELSRHSHAAPDVAARSFEFLRACGTFGVR